MSDVGGLYEEYLNSNEKLKDRIDKNKNKEVKSTKSKKSTLKRTKGGDRTSKDEIIVMEHFDTDDEIVTVIKSEVNKKQITLNDIYDYADEKGHDGYNLFYGLATRPSMSTTTLKRWFEILNVELSLVDKGNKNSNSN